MKHFIYSNRTLKYIIIMFLHNFIKIRYKQSVYIYFSKKNLKLHCINYVRFRNWFDKSHNKLKICEYLHKNKTRSKKCLCSIINSHRCYNVWLFNHITSVVQVSLRQFYWQVITVYNFSSTCLNFSSHSLDEFIKNVILICVLLILVASM